MRRDDEIPVPTELRRPHGVIGATREDASGRRPDGTGRLDVGRRPGVMYLRVSRDQLRRSLLIGQAILAEAERRGYEIKPVEKGYDHRPGVAISVRGHPYPVEIHEMTDRFTLDERELERWRRDNDYRLRWNPNLKPQLKHVPNGRLRLSLPDVWVKRANWTEGPRGPLEGKLGSVFVELERRAADDDRRDEERRREAVERERQAEIRREHARLQALEDARVARLREEVDRWRLARDARAYATAMRAALDDERGDWVRRVVAWCEWIERWAERTDPVANQSAVSGLQDELEEASDLEEALWPQGRAGCGS